MLIVCAIVLYSGVSRVDSCPCFRRGDNLAQQFSQSEIRCDISATNTIRIKANSVKHFNAKGISHKSTRQKGIRA